MQSKAKKPTSAPTQAKPVTAMKSKGKTTQGGNLDTMSEAQFKKVAGIG